MKKFLSLFAITLFYFSFAQIQIDLTKKQAYERFKNSNVRKACKIPLKDFNENWIYIIKSDYYNKSYKISELLIFKSTSNKNIEKIKKVYFNNKNCMDCNQIAFEKEENIKNYNAFGALE